MLFATATWEQIESVRTGIGMLKVVPTVQEAAQEFAMLLGRSFSSVVLARVFVVVPFSALGSEDRAVARRTVGDDARLGASTRVLSLLGTSGREKAWGDRLRSKGHLAIPLLDRKFVEGAPMIAKLLADLDVDLQGLESGLPIATRPMLGGKSQAFYVPDARTALDAAGRPIIRREFVDQYDLRTVFGMGGAYLDGVLAVAIVFSSEPLDRATVDRFPSFISSFRMATAEAEAQNRIYES